MDFFESKLFQGIIIGLGCLIIIALVFKIGVFVGQKKAEFSFMWGQNYHRNFGDFIDANGSFGQIIKISGPSLVVKDADGEERIVLVNNGTSIKYFRGEIKLSELKIGDNIVVIGDINKDGRIEAKLIRVMPPPPPLI